MIKGEIEALEYAKLSEIPKKWDGKSDWKKAVALVTKANGNKCYAIAHCENGKLTIVKDFNISHIIIEINEIYPYEFYSKPKKSAK